MKICKRCDVAKAESDFPRNSKMADGLHYYCKECMNEASKKRYEQAVAIKSTFSDFSSRPRFCKDCDTEKTNGDFASGSNSVGIAPRCRDCDNLRKRARRYSLSVEGLKEMLSGGCEACGSFEKLCIDHDHKCCPYKSSPITSCGKCIRGVLCTNCNTIEGHIYSKAQIDGLIAYMQKHNVF